MPVSSVSSSAPHFPHDDLRGGFPSDKFRLKHQQPVTNAPHHCIVSTILICVLTLYLWRCTICQWLTTRLWCIKDGESGLLRSGDATVCAALAEDPSRRLGSPDLNKKGHAWVDAGQVPLDSREDAAPCPGSMGEDLVAGFIVRPRRCRAGGDGVECR